MQIPRATIPISLFLITFGVLRLMTADEAPTKSAKPAAAATEKAPAPAAEAQKLQSITAAAQNALEGQKRVEAFIAGLDYGFRLGQRNPDMSLEMARSLGLPLWRQAEAQQSAAAKQQP